MRHQSCVYMRELCDRVCTNALKAVSKTELSFKQYKNPRTRRQALKPLQLMNK